MSLLSQILSAVLNGIVKLFTVILNPVLYISGFENIANRLRRRDSANNRRADDPSTVMKKARRRKTTAVVAVLAIVVSLVSLQRTLLPSAPENSRQPFVGLGQVLGEETVKILGDHGRVVVVVWDDHKQAGNLLNDALEAFRGVLKKHPKIQITATEVIRSDTNKHTMVDNLSSKMFNELVEKHTQADGLVLFTGLPTLESQPPIQLPVPHPQIIAVQTSEPLTKSYFDRKIVNVAVSSSSEQVPTGSAANPQTPREWFDRFFQVFTIENYATLQN